MRIRRQSKWRFLFSPIIFLVMAAGAGVALVWSYYTSIYPLALNVYHESRGESVYGQLMVAYVTVARAREDRPEWGGKSVRGVVYKKDPCQFAWTCDPTTVPAQSGPEWDTAVWAAMKALWGKFTPDGMLARARYYMNPEKLDRDTKCWFAKNLSDVGMVDHHFFYAEPYSGEAYSIEFGCVPLPRMRPTPTHTAQSP